MDQLGAAHLELLEEMAEAAASQRVGEEQLLMMRGYADGVIRTMVVFGSITRDEAEEWRERLRRYLGSEFGKPRSFRIEKEGGVPMPDAAVESAYGSCRDGSLIFLAHLHDTAANEEAITAAIADGHPEERERMLRACRLGFGDRGKSVVRDHDL